MTWICCFAERKYQVLLSNRENNNTGGRQKKIFFFCFFNSGLSSFQKEDLTTQMSYFKTGLSE